MAERNGKPDRYALYTPPETPKGKPAEGDQVVRRKVGKTTHSPLATLLTDVPEAMRKSPFQVAALARPCPGELNVNNPDARRPCISRPVIDDVTTRADPKGKMDGQPSSITELEKDITARIEEGFMQRMSLAMERAFGLFLESSVTKPQESEAHANAYQANANREHVGTNHASVKTATSKNKHAAVATHDANVPGGGLDSQPAHHSDEGASSVCQPVERCEKCCSLTATPASSPAAANRPGDLVPALTAALTTALMRVQQPSPRDVRLKVGRYDGLTSWETYWAQFGLLAAANGWSPAERAVHLISALEGEARKVLLDVTAADLENPQAISRALERRFGTTTPAVVMRQRFNERMRAPGEKLGVFAAELRYLAQRGFPEFDDETRLVLTKEAFIRGLLPLPLRQQVRLADPQTLEAALEKALAVEDILIEGFDNLSGQVSTRPKSQASPQIGPTSLPTGPGRPFPSPEDRQRQICWRCNQGGHTWRFCPILDSALGVPASGNAQGQGRGEQPEPTFAPQRL